LFYNGVGAGWKKKSSEENKTNKYLVKTILIELSIVAEVKSLHNTCRREGWCLYTIQEGGGVIILDKGVYTVQCVHKNKL